jgi:hypothetical protein
MDAGTGGGMGGVTGGGGMGLDGGDDGGIDAGSDDGGSTPGLWRGVPGDMAFQSFEAASLVCASR